jgi:hypothetical protein
VGSRRQHERRRSVLGLSAPVCTKDEQVNQGGRRRAAGRLPAAEPRGLYDPHHYRSGDFLRLPDSKVQMRVKGHWQTGNHFVDAKVFPRLFISDFLRGLPHQATQQQGRVLARNLTNVAIKEDEMTSHYVP